MIAFIDIETSGIDPLQHEVIEVGVVVAEHRDIKDTLEFSLPFDLEKAQPKALEVNGWGEREFAPQLDHLEAVKKLDEFWDAWEPEVTTSWHTHFDFPFLQAWHSRLGYPHPWGHRSVLDMPSLVMGRMGVCAAESQRAVMKRLGLVEWENQHRALADAQAVFNVYCALELWEIT